MKDTPENRVKDDWLSLARMAFEGSTTWINANLRTQLERNNANFHSRHPKGSKYHRPEYEKRNRHFRPKTRSMERKNEAAAATAFFSTQDVVSVDPQDDSDPRQLASAEINKELLNYRLQHTIPWFKIIIGGIQDAQVNGVVIGYAGWDYREEEELVLAGEEDGKQVYAPSTKVVSDRPVVKLLAIENFRFDPASDWMDPVNTSPYLIEMIPMYIGHVKERMDIIDPKTGQPKWKKHSDKEIQKAVTNQFDSIRQAREKQRSDPKSDRAMEITDYTIVWIHRNIIRKDGKDKLYYTLGTELMLTSPIPLEEAYWTGQRPYVVGNCIIETHKNYPSGTVELGENLQSSTNDLANQRRDNVDLVLNKRYKVKRTGNVDIMSLMRNVPGGGVLMNDVNDVETFETPDVTSSSYMEQDRIDNDYDGLVGDFSQSSVQNNRAVNDTVGGMQLLAAGAGQMTDYLLRTYVETFVEPLLRLLVKLEQKYETDTVVLAIAAKKAKLYQRFGIDQITDDLLDQELTVNVNVGIGSTDPMAKVDRFLYGLQALSRVKPDLMAKLNDKEVTKEIFGRLGYKDGYRFFEGIDEENPYIKQLEQTIQQLQQSIDDDVAKEQARGQIDLQKTQMTEEGETYRLFMKLKADIERADKTMQGEERKIISNKELEEARGKKELEKIAYQKRLEKNPNALPVGEDADNLRQSISEVMSQLQGVYQEHKQITQQHASEMSDLPAIREQLSLLPRIVGMLQSISDYQNAPRKIVRDADNRPVGVAVEGHDTLPIQRGPEGQIESIG